MGFIILEQLGVTEHHCRCMFLGSGLTLLSLRTDAPGEAFTLNLTLVLTRALILRWEGTLVWLVFSSGLLKHRWLDGVPAGCCPPPPPTAGCPLHGPIPPQPPQMKVKAVFSGPEEKQTQGLLSVRTGLSHRRNLLFPISVYSSMLHTGS